MTNYLKNKVLDATFNDTPLTITTPFGDVYASLHSTPCDANTAGTELSSATDLGYARCRLYMDPASDGIVLNSSVVSFAASGSNWTGYVSLGIYDQPTGGNLLYYTNSILPKTLQDGDHVDWQAGTFGISLG